MRRLAPKLFTFVRSRNGRKAVSPSWLGCSLVILSLTPAARAEYHFDAWTTADGLPQNSVLALRQTRDGYLWMTTQDGVARFEEIAEAAAESLAEVREIAHNLRPFQLDRLGLTKAIEALVRKANSPALRVTARLDKVDPQLSPEMEINLYRIVQESLSNIIKHSGASEARPGDRLVSASVKRQSRPAKRLQRPNLTGGKQSDGGR